MCRSFPFFFVWGDLIRERAHPHLETGKQMCLWRRKGQRSQFAWERNVVSNALIPWHVVSSVLCVPSFGFPHTALPGEQPQHSLGGWRVSEGRHLHRCLGNADRTNPPRDP